MIRPEPSGSAAPWDLGLQPERTTLAWVRTLLSLLVADVVLARLTVERSTLLALLVLAVPVPVTLHLLRSLERRASDVLRRLRDSVPLGDASRLTAVLTSVVLAIALLELVAVCLR